MVTLDSWQTSAWGKITTEIATPSRSRLSLDEHF
jgi:hypothetical protein